MSTPFHSYYYYYCSWVFLPSCYAFCTVLPERRVLSEVWLGVVQRNPLDVDQFREYKWERSDVDVPSTEEMWANRYHPSESQAEICGYFMTTLVDSRLLDGSCSFARYFICEW